MGSNGSKCSEYRLKLNRETPTHKGKWVAKVAKVASIETQAKQRYTSEKWVAKVAKVAKVANIDSS